MGGSRGGGSTTTINQPLTKKQYDPTGYFYREQLLPKLYGKYDYGLTPQEQAYYRARGLTDIENAYGASLKSLREHLARTGIGPSDGAYAETMADLLRAKLGARADLAADIAGKDIAQKQQNLVNLLSLIADSGMVGSAGQTQTYTMPGRSAASSAIGGGIAGALGGAALNKALGGALGPLGAIGGAVLGGLGGLL